MKKDDHEVLRACKDVQKNKIIIIIIIIIIIVHWRYLPRIFICWFGSRISGPLGSPEPYYAPWNEQRVFPWNLNEGRIASHVLRSLPRTGQVLYRWVLAPRFFFYRGDAFFFQDSWFQKDVILLKSPSFRNLGGLWNIIIHHKSKKDVYISPRSPADQNKKNVFLGWSIFLRIPYQWASRFVFNHSLGQMFGGIFMRAMAGNHLVRSSWLEQQR